jgi:hypothetical protein
VLTRNFAVDVRVYRDSLSADPLEIDVTQAASLDRIVVTATLPYADIKWVALPIVSGINILRAQGHWVSLKNMPFPANSPEPPQG